MKIDELVALQREYYTLGETKKVDFRKNALLSLKKEIIKREKDINLALNKDLSKSPFEAYMTEVGMTLSELDFVIKKVKKWAKTKRVPTPLAQFAAKSFVMPEPYGVVLIMAPWNYPFMLTLEPLVGAIAAGNCCILKPSAYSPNTSAIIKEIVEAVFPEKYVAVVEGGRDKNTELLNQRFDYIFFTGSMAVGRLVMEKAAANLTPVSLELGGKSPCIVEKSANLKLAAKRLAFGKTLNAGQTCVAPDYLLIDESVKKEFLEYYCDWVKKMYTEEPLKNPSLVKIINRKHFDRIVGLIEQNKVILGGKSDEELNKIEPTVMDNVTLKSPIMQEEIFGPVLPVITFKSIEEVPQLQSSVLDGSKPLALYLFTQNKQVEKFILEKISFGGGCINDTIVHLATPHMGFGGVGNSGMGSYHGKLSFDTFSHHKSILKKANWIDLPIRYQPETEGKEKLLRKFM